MKSFSYIVFFICINSYAQDTIIKLNNDRFIGNVVKVGGSVIEYKLDTSIFYIPTPNVKEIRYKDGKIEYPKEIRKELNKANQQTGVRVYNNNYYFNEHKISEWELYEYLHTQKNTEVDSEILLAKKMNRLQYTGFIGIPLGITAITYWAASTNVLCLFCQPDPFTNDEKLIFSALTIGAISCPVSSAVFKAKRKGHNKRAVEIYNQKY